VDFHALTQSAAAHLTDGLTKGATLIFHRLLFCDYLPCIYGRRNGGEREYNGSANSAATFDIFGPCGIIFFSGTLLWQSGVVQNLSPQHTLLLKGI